jgi:DNA-binding CsgD family transcriptional regulator
VVADTVLREYLLAGLAHFAGDGAAQDGACPACGASRAAAEGLQPQPMDKASLLTSRERVVFRLLGFGYDNRSIARELQISERTVKRYVTGILAKLELQSRLQAGLAALVISSSPAADAYWPKGRMDLTPGAGEPVDELRIPMPWRQAWPLTHWARSGRLATRWTC